MIIAIDGPAGSGKSTTSRAVASRLGYAYLDTGAMYRAVALAFMRRNEEETEAGAERLLSTIQLDLRPTEDGMHLFLDDEDVTESIRRPDVSATSSRIATLAAVRKRLREDQRRLGRAYREQGGGVVIDGRDVGTVVFPEADVKFFMTADESVRARRRFEEIRRQRADVCYEDVVAEIRRRDEQDVRRAEAPLRMADDAIELDTSRLSLEEQIDRVLQAIKERQDLSSV